MKKYIIITISFLIMLTLGYFAYNSIVNIEKKKEVLAIRSEIYLRTLLLSDKMIHLFNDYASKAKRITFYFADKDVIPTEADLKLFFNHTEKTRLKLLNIAFADNNGTCLSIYPKEYSASVGLNYSFRNYFKKAQETDKVVFSKPLKNYCPHEKALEYGAITIIAPIINSADKKLGYILLDIDVFNIKEFIPSKLMDKESKLKFYIVDTDNNEILASPQIPDSNKLSIHNKNFSSFIINFARTHNEDRFFSSSISGEKAFFVVSPLKIGSNSMAVVAMLPYKKSIISTTNFFSELSLIMTFTALVLFFIFGFIIYHEFIVKKLRSQISCLKIVIDENNRNENVEEISQTDYFKELRKKIKSMKG
jgi:hypothetical protein